MAPTRSASALSSIIGAGAIMALVLPPVVGALSDRCAHRWGRRRPYMLAGVALNLAGLLGLWLAGAMGSLPGYLIGYLLVQLGNNLATASYTGIIPDLVPPAQHGQASGYMAVMVQAGSIVGAVGGGLLMGHGHVRASYALIALSLVLFLWITCIAAREAPIEVPPSRIDWLQILRGFWVDPREHPDFAWVWITRALVTMGLWMVQPFVQYYLRDVVGVANPAQMAGLMLGVILIGATITGIIGGYVSDRIGRKRVVYAANGIVALAALAFPLHPTLGYTFAVAVVYGLGFGAYYSVDWALGCDVLPNPEDAAKDMGVWHISMVLPQAVAPWISARILEGLGKGTIKGQYTVEGYAWLFGLSALFMVLGAIFLRNVKGVR